jgi:hypothetical protein
MKNIEFNINKKREVTITFNGHVNHEQLKELIDELNVYLLSHNPSLIEVKSTDKVKAEYVYFQMKKCLNSYAKKQEIKIAFNWAYSDGDTRLIEQLEPSKFFSSTSTSIV